MTSEDLEYCAHVIWDFYMMLLECFSVAC